MKLDDRAHRVLDHIDAHAEEGLEFFRRLVRIQSSDPPGDVREIADACAEFGEALGIGRRRLAQEGCFQLRLRRRSRRCALVGGGDLALLARLAFGFARGLASRKRERCSNQDEDRILPHSHPPVHAPSPACLGPSSHGSEGAPAKHRCDGTRRERVACRRTIRRGSLVGP